MTRICLVVLVGLPALGKTTFSEWVLHNNVLEKSFNILHFCYDDFFNATQKDENNFDTDEYHTLRRNILKRLEQICQRIANNENLEEFKPFLNVSILSKDHDSVIICDDNFYYRSMRFEIYQLCKRSQYGFGQIYFGSDLEKSLECNAIRKSTHRLPDSVIKRMSKYFDPPNPSRHRWESQTLNLSSHPIPFHDKNNLINNFIYDVFDNVPFVNLNNLHCIYSNEIKIRKHHLDILLRRKITKLIKESAFENPKAMQLRAAALNDKRVEILKAYRDNIDVNLDTDYYVEMLQ